jgi:cytochrome c5
MLEDSYRHLGVNPARPMPLRFFRRVRIAPGLSVNLSKSGASVSVGPKGAKVTVGPKGVRKTVGLPGTGVYYTTTSRLHEAATEPNLASAPPPTGARGFWGRRSRKGKATIVVVALLAIGALNPTAAATPTPTPTLPGTAAGLTAAANSQAPVRTETPAARTTSPTTAAVAVAAPAPTPVATVKATAKPTAKPTPKPTPRPAARCHPSYTPCLPIVADLNCPAVRAMGKAPVRVIGPDVYRLDADHDGIGCE